MTTLLHLTQSIADMQNELTREQRFSSDARRNLLNGVKLLRDAVDALEKDILSNFEERDRSIARMIGNSQPYTTVIENVPQSDPRKIGVVEEETQTAA